MSPSRNPDDRTIDLIGADDCSLIAGEFCDPRGAQPGLPFIVMVPQRAPAIPSPTGGELDSMTDYMISHGMVTPTQTIMEIVNGYAERWVARFGPATWEIFTHTGLCVARGTGLTEPPTWRRSISTIGMVGLFYAPGAALRRGPAMSEELGKCMRRGKLCAGMIPASRDES